jgi:hypothetical protein
LGVFFIGWNKVVLVYVILGLDELLLFRRVIDSFLSIDAVEIIGMSENKIQHFPNNNHGINI